jgi:type IV secretion system protein VirD4
MIGTISIMASPTPIVETVEPQKPYSSGVDNILERLATPKMIGLVALLIGIFVFTKVMSNGGKVLADARWANSFEIWGCRRKAINQMRQKKKPNIAIGLGSDFSGRRMQVLLPFLAPGLKLIGKSGGGKTDSVINSAIRDLAEQGATLLVYDKKGDLTPDHAAYLLKLGYEIWVYPFDGFNPLKKMKGPNDVDGAYSAISTLHKNLAEKNTKSGDPFFGPQGMAALEVACLFAKASLFPDLVMAFAFLSLPDLAARLSVANEDATLGVWAKLSSTGLRSISNAAQTVAGVVGSAVLNIKKLMSEKSIQALINDDIPLKLDGKKAVFFQVDKEREEISIPSIAAAIELIVKASCGEDIDRQTPLALILDEGASMTLPSMGQWLSEYRSYWFVQVAAFQNEAQLLMHMSKHEANSNQSNMGTTIYLEANDMETSKMISERCGATEKKIWEKDRWHRHKVNLIEPQKLEQRRPGDAIIFTPGLNKVPLRVRIRLNKKDEEITQWCKEKWKNDLKPQYEKRNAERLKVFPIEPEIEDRMAIANTLLPTPQVVKALKALNKPFSDEVEEKKEAKTQEESLIKVYKR